MILDRIAVRINRMRADLDMDRQIRAVEDWLPPADPSGDDEQPVLFFNASTRIHRLSLNGAFSLLASWGLRARSIPVSYVVCHSGMDQCILGVDRSDLSQPPPCGPCIEYSERIFPAGHTVPLLLDLQTYHQATRQVDGLAMDELFDWQWGGMNLGQLCLPGLRWVLRRHTLPDEEPVRKLYCQFLASGASLAGEFARILDRERPRALLVFNGLFYPEAVAREVAQQRSIPVVTHEVGLRDRSAFFSHGEATFRELSLERGEELSPGQSQRLDNYLSSRFEGKFEMAGIQFWPEMGDLPTDLMDKIADFDSLVPVFTNVIFDTSQVHANSIYESMFEWLDDVLEAVDQHPDTLFVIRAHPDEDRPGKRSRESVAEWVADRSATERTNLVFLAPNDYVSSYDLIRRSDFVMVYNSSIGLEASIMGSPVLCAGRARFTQLPTVYYPASRDEYRRLLGRALESGLETQADHQEHARAFLYHEYFQASLDLSEFMEPYPASPGMVYLTGFDPERLSESQSLEVISDGILNGKSFLLLEDWTDENKGARTALGAAEKINEGV